MKNALRRLVKLLLFGLLGFLGIILVYVAVVWAGSPASPRLGTVPPAPPPLSHAPAAFALEVVPDTALADVPVSIRVLGLERREIVVLRAATEDADGREFSSWARFEADRDGTLDLSKAVPLEGTYRSADPSGLLWSMRSVSEVRFRSSERWTDRTYRISAETRRGVTESEVVRQYPWTWLTEEKVQIGGIPADLWIPDSDRPIPVVIWLGGSGGGPSRSRAAFLASRGLAVLDLLYHSTDGGLPEMVAIPIERVTDAIDWVSAHPRLDGERIGLFGTSKGAELALQTAAREPRLRAVAVWAPASVAFEGISFRKLHPGSTWTWDGIPVPYAPYRINLSALANPVRMVLRRPMHLRPIYERALEHAPEDAFTPVERIAARILLLSGADDQMTPSAVMAGQIQDRMDRHGRSDRLRNLVYDGAGHGMAFQLWPDGGQPEQRVLRGGSLEADHLAGQAAWSEILAFFTGELGHEDPEVP